MTYYRKTLTATTFLIVLASANTNSHAFSFSKSCIDTKNNFRHHIIDSNIIKFSNSTKYSAAIVQCTKKRGRFAFSFFDKGYPFHPDNSIRMEPKNEKVCEGDILYVYDEECVIITMSKPEPLRHEEQESDATARSKPFIMWERLQKDKKIIDSLD